MFRQLLHFLMLSLLLSSPVFKVQAQPDSTHATDKILLKNGQYITEADLYEIHNGWVVYKKKEGLHDILIEDIKWIRTPKWIIIFNSKGQPDSLHYTKSREKQLLKKRPPSPQVNSSLSEFHLIIKSNPLSLIVPRPHITLGGEFSLGKRFSFQPIVGYHFSGPMLYFNDRYIQDGWVLKSSLKYFRSPSTPLEGEFIALQFIKRKINFRNNEANHTNLLAQTTYRFHFYAGHQWFWGNHFVFEFFGGGGIKIAKRKIAYPSYKNHEKEAYPDITGGIRLGFH